MASAVTDQEISDLMNARLCVRCGENPFTHMIHLSPTADAADNFAYWATWRICSPCARDLAEVWSRG